MVLEKDDENKFEFLVFGYNIDEFIDLDKLVKNLIGNEILNDIFVMCCN